MLERLPRRRLRGRARARGRRDRGPLPDRPDRDVPRPRRRARPRRGAASLRPFFAPRRVAVVGASRRRGSIGGELFRNILAADFTGAAYPVNRGRRARRRACAATRRSPRCPRPVDLAVDLPARARVLDAAAGGARARRQARSASSPRASPRSAARAASARTELLALVRAHGARLVGPELPRHRRPAARPERDLRAARAPARPDRLLLAERRARARAAREGGGARASASRPSSRSGTRPTSPRTTCSSGGRTTPATELVLLYLESFGNPRKFGRLARRVARRKPILALKAGHDGRRRAGGELAHGGARRLRRRGRRALPPGGRAPRAHARGARRRGRAALEPAAAAAAARVGVLTNAGGLGILCADACEAAGPRAAASSAEETRAALAGLVPAEASLANPVDMLGSATAATLRGRRCRRCSPTRGSTR